MASLLLTEAKMNGRTFGKCTIVHKVKGVTGAWACVCGLCGKQFDCDADRILNGSAAKNGCGCRMRRNAKGVYKGPDVMGPMPRARYAYSKENR